MAPCPRGWRVDSGMTAEICRMAVNSKFWPLFEVENGKWKLMPVRDKNLIPVKDFLKPQGRFKTHLFKPGNEHIIEEIQADVDAYWAYRGPCRRVQGPVVDTAHTVNLPKADRGLCLFYGGGGFG